ncbi:MAG: TerB family tellurite resistance protein [Planctomycetes bacterium]|nr:TerB family tellurite resistance protein [Planctomycetota bacterium]
MSTVSYASVEPLLVNSEVVGKRLRCSFRCPVGKGVFTGEVPIEPPKTARLASLSRWAESLGWALRAAVGAQPAAQDSSAAVEVTEEERHDATVRAFLAVNPPFLWDAERGSWVNAASAGNLNPRFTLRLAKAPVSDPEDQHVLARVLAELARADGHVDTEEWAFLAEFVLAETGSIYAIMDEPPLTAEELQQVTPEVRESVLMIGWALVLADSELRESETRLLSEWAEGFGIPPERQDRLRRDAARFVLAQHLSAAYPKGVLDPAIRDDAVKHARDLGLDDEEIAQVENLHRMRNAIR